MNLPPTSGSRGATILLTYRPILRRKVRTVFNLRPHPTRPSPDLTRPHPTSPDLTRPHPTSPNLTRPHPHLTQNMINHPKSEQKKNGLTTQTQKPVTTGCRGQNPAAPVTCGSPNASRTCGSRPKNTDTNSFRSSSQRPKSGLNPRPEYVVGYGLAARKCCGKRRNVGIMLG